MVLVDTDILVKALGQDSEHLPEVSKLLEKKAAVISSIQIAEIYSETMVEETATLIQFLELFEFQAYDRDTAVKAGEFMQQYQEFYPELTTVDCLVGAICALHDLEIYTTRAKQYPMTEVSLYHKTKSSLTVRSKQRLDS